MPQRRTCSCSGWTGDYNTPDNFIGTFFADRHRFSTGISPWGATLSAELAAADAIPDAAERTPRTSS